MINFNNIRKRGLITATACLALGGVGTAVTFAATDQQEKSSAPPIEALKAAAEANKAHPSVAARGISVETARPVFTLANGVEASVASKGEVSCVLLSKGTDTCASLKERAQGYSLHSELDCTQSPLQGVTVAGLAPEGATAGVLQFSDGAQQALQLKDGAFGAVLDNVTRTHFPVARVFTGKGGLPVATFPAPPGGFDGYCPPTA